MQLLFWLCTLSTKLLLHTFATKYCVILRNSALKILIVEDDISFTLELEMILDEMGYQTIGSVDNSAEALDIIFSKEPDLILMDIDIKGNLSGTEIGQKVKHLNIPIIFITSFGNKERYEEARQSNMAAYLVKPANAFTLQSTIDSIVSKMTEDKVSVTEAKEKENVFGTSVFVKKNKTYHKILLEEIQYAEASGNYSILYVDKDKFVSNFKFKDLEDILPANLFMKVHRSYIMNVNYFSSINIEENIIKMDNGAAIPVSRSNKQALLDRMNLG